MAEKTKTVMMMMIFHYIISFKIITSIHTRLQSKHVAKSLTENNNLAFGHCDELFSEIPDDSRIMPALMTSHMMIHALFITRDGNAFSHSSTDVDGRGD